MRLTTPVTIGQASVPIALGTPVFCLGSCFANRVSQKLSQHLFPTVSNPFGILYNPVSLSQVLSPAPQNEPLLLHERQWRSLQTHSKLAAATPSEARSKIEHAQNLSRQALDTSELLILTLGTALVYQQIHSGRIVANCQRLPQTHFRRRRLTVDEAVEALGSPLRNWLAQSPRRQVVLTVSPVRHLKDGAVENSRSKAVLLLACDELVRNSGQLSYFPAYEIFLDELRSYRFYSEDMIHPTEQSLEFVWQRFLQSYLNPAERTAFGLLSKVLSAREHRLEASSETQKFSASALAKLDRLEELSPGLKTQELRHYFTQILGSVQTRG